MSIKIYYDQIKYRISKSREIKSFLEKVIKGNYRIPGDLNFIFTSDIKIQELNNKFLKRDYSTDVIAFDNSIKNMVNGEIYISVESVRRNAKQYNVKIKEELIRVMIHGLLHLLGYRDKLEQDKNNMFEIQESLVRQFENTK